MSTHPDTKIRYRANAMILHIHSNDNYLPEAKSQSKPPPLNFPPPPLNATMHVLSTIMKNIPDSTVEVKLRTLFYNAQKSIIIRITLVKLGHPQPPSPIQTGNLCAVGIANGTVK